MAIFTYHINKDERGDFYADVRRGGSNGETVFELHGFDIFEDGFMKHKNDMDGLADHLRSLHILQSYDRIGTEEEADTVANSNVLRVNSSGDLLFPAGYEILHRYPAGDFDNIKATNPNLNHLRKALYDARECGEVPDVNVFILPNGDTIDIDTPEPEEEAKAPKRVYEVKVVRTVTTYFYRDQEADSPEEAKRLAAEYADRNVSHWQFSNLEYAAEIEDEDEDKRYIMGSTGIE